MYLLCIPKGRDFIGVPIRKTPLCHEKVHRGVLKLRKGVLTEYSRVYSDARYHLSMAKCRGLRAASSAALLYDINRTDGTQNLVSPCRYAEGFGSYHEIYLLPHLSHVVNMSRNVNNSISGTMVARAGHRIVFRPEVSLKKEIASKLSLVKQAEPKK